MGGDVIFTNSEARLEFGIWNGVSSAGCGCVVAALSCNGGLQGGGPSRGGREGRSN